MPILAGGRGGPCLGEGVVGGVTVVVQRVERHFAMAIRDMAAAATRGAVVARNQPLRSIDARKTPDLIIRAIDEIEFIRRRGDQIAPDENAVLVRAVGAGDDLVNLIGVIVVPV